MTARFAGRGVLVTGGSSGIGRAAALAFAAEGAEVVVAARDGKRLGEVVGAIQSAGGAAYAHRCDVTSESQCGEMVEAALGDIGKIDVLFNNAGVIFRDRTVADTDPDVWDDTFAVNVRGTYLVSRAVIPHMVQNGGGAIVNTASYYGLVGGRGVAAYSASKGAIVLLTKSMALDHAPEGIRVNCVCPGSVDTPMLRSGAPQEIVENEMLAASAAKHPVGRIGTPDEVAAAVLYLASDEAGFVTGVALPVDGGITAA